MKLLELFGGTQGTYAGVRFCPTTVKGLHEYCMDHKIANPVSPDKFHTTLLYSRKLCPNYKPAGSFATPLVGNAKALEYWPSQPSAGNPQPTNCLVLCYDCTDLIERHKYLMHTHGATYDYPEYKPHITLSYNAGPQQTDYPLFNMPIRIVEEYGEPLNIGWADDHR